MRLLWVLWWPELPVLREWLPLLLLSWRVDGCPLLWLFMQVKLKVQGCMVT